METSLHFWSESVCLYCFEHFYSIFGREFEGKKKEIPSVCIKYLVYFMYMYISHFLTFDAHQKGILLEDEEEKGEE